VFELLLSVGSVRNRVSTHVIAIVVASCYFPCITIRLLVVLTPRTSMHMFMFHTSCPWYCCLLT